MRKRSREQKSRELPGWQEHCGDGEELRNSSRPPRLSSLEMPRQCHREADRKGSWHLTVAGRGKMPPWTPVVTVTMKSRWSLINRQHSCHGGFFFFFLFLAAQWRVGSQFPDQGLNLHPLQWEGGVLISGYQGSPWQCFFFFFFTIFPSLGTSILQERVLGSSLGDNSSFVN